MAKNSHYTPESRGEEPRREQQKKYIPTSPDDPNAEEMGVWQPERLTFKQGLQQLSPMSKVMYALLLLATAYLNYTSYLKLPEMVSLKTWFGYSSATVPTVFYFIVTFLLIAYLVYRDIVNRSLSRRKFFIPLIFYFGNYFMIDYLLSSVVS